MALSGINFAMNQRKPMWLGLKVILSFTFTDQHPKALKIRVKHYRVQWYFSISIRFQEDVLCAISWFNPSVLNNKRFVSFVPFILLLIWSFRSKWEMQILWSIKLDLDLCWEVACYWLIFLIFLALITQNWLAKYWLEINYLQHFPFPIIIYWGIIRYFGSTHKKHKSVENH